VSFDFKENVQLFSRKMQIDYEEQLHRLIMQELPLVYNPTFLVCLILFRDIFDKIKDSSKGDGNIVDLFERILLNHYERKSPVERQIFLQILIYLSSTRTGLLLDELEELLVSKDHFCKRLVQEAIEEFVEIFDFAYTYNPESKQLMNQNFSFVKSIGELIKSVNKKPIPREILQSSDVEFNDKVTYGRKEICLNIVSLIEKQSFSLRQLDELAFQYQKGRLW
jgi:hypothetical protein